MKTQENHQESSTVATEIKKPFSGLTTQAEIDARRRPGNWEHNITGATHGSHDHAMGMAPDHD